MNQHRSKIIFLLLALIPLLGIFATYKYQRITSEKISKEIKADFENKTNPIRFNFQSKIDNIQNIIRKASLLTNGNNLSNKILNNYLTIIKNKTKDKSLIGIGYIGNYSNQSLLKRKSNIKNWKLTKELRSDYLINQSHPILYFKDLGSKFNSFSELTSKNKYKQKLNKASKKNSCTTLKFGKKSLNLEVLFIPTYSSFPETDNENERKKLNTGWIFAIINLNRLLKEITNSPEIKNITNELDIELFYSSNRKKSELIFDSYPKIHSSISMKSKNVYKNSTPFYIGDSLLTLNIEFKKKFIPKKLNRETNTILVSGIIISALLLLLFILIINTRYNSLKIANHLTINHKNNESKFRIIAENAPIGIIRINEFGECVYVNKQWEKITNKSFQEAYRLGWFNCIDIKERDDFKRNWEEHSNSKKTHQNEFKLNIAADNKPIISFYANPVISDSGEFKGYIGTWEDITQSKATEKAFIEENKTLFLIIENAPVPMAMFDKELKYAAISEKWKDIFINNKQNEIIGERFESTTFECFKHLQENQQTALLRSEVQSSTEEEFQIDKENSTFLSWAIHPLLDQNSNPKGIVMVAYQINDFVSARTEAQKSMEFKSKFLANMSHEIRTPLNGLVGMLELLKHTNLDSEQNEFTTLIESSAYSLLGIINDILDLSKIESGKLILENIPLNLRELIDDTLKVFAPNASVKNIHVMSNYSLNFPIEINGDPSRLKQIISNFLSNAIKFTENGHVVINSSISDDKSILIIEVKDTGIGISENNIKKLFKSFSQADDSTTRKYGGTGLGLNICKQLTEKMKGEIGVSSVVNQGSNFFFRIPLNLNSSDTLSIPSSLKNKNILLINDYPPENDIITNQLMNIGINCISTLNIQDTIDLLKSFKVKFDFILHTIKNEKDFEQTLNIIAEKAGIAKHYLIGLTALNNRKHALRQKRENQYSEIITTPLSISSLINTMELSQNPKNVQTAIQANSYKDKVKNIPYRGHALVVDDNEINLKFATSALKLIGFESTTANNGLEAIEYFKNNNFTFILMDCQMPILDGYQATIKIRELEKNSNKEFTPIIAMTASAMEDELEHCTKVGMNDITLKPIKISDFHKKIKEWVHFDETQQESIKNQFKPIPQEQISKKHFTLGDIQTVNMEMLKEWQEAIGLTNQELTEQILNPYFESAIKFSHNLKTAMEANNCDRIMKLSHAFSSSSGTVGAQRVHKLCKYLEELGREKAEDIPMKLFSELQMELNLYKLEVNEILKITNIAI